MLKDELCPGLEMIAITSVTLCASCLQCQTEVRIVNAVQKGDQNMLYGYCQKEVSQVSTKYDLVLIVLEPK